MSRLDVVGICLDCGRIASYQWRDARGIYHPACTRCYEARRGQIKSRLVLV